MSRRAGSTTVRVGEVASDIDSLTVTGTRRSTTVSAPGAAFSLSTVEHLFAALGAHGLTRGVNIDVTGSELPLLGGGASEYCRALASLKLRPVPSLLRVVRAGIVETGASRYVFSVADRAEVHVEIAFGDARIFPTASWLGDAADFDERIAPARTFVFERDLSQLAADGLVRHASPESVVVIGERIHAGGPAFELDEPARHKLLDLVGDAFLYGGPPVGKVHALRPGHTANHEAFRAAIARGLLARTPLAARRR